MLFLKREFIQIWNSGEYFHYFSRILETVNSQKACNGYFQKKKKILKQSNPIAEINKKWLQEKVNSI